MSNPKTFQHPKICVISFSEIARDARVLRQIECLMEFAFIKVIGFGDAPQWLEDSVNSGRIVWVNLPRSPHKWLKDSGQKIARARKFAKYFPFLFKSYYESVRYWQLARFEALLWEPDLIFCNELDPLPIAGEAKLNFKDIRVVLDMHELAPDQYGQEHTNFWKFIRPKYLWILKKYQSTPNQVITVSDGIARILKKKYQLKNPKVVFNAPPLTSLKEREISQEPLRLVHHGGASPFRKQDTMIEAVSLCEKDVELHFFLVGKDSVIDELKSFAGQVCPEKVFFHAPVVPADIPKTIQQYDVGIHILPKYSLNADWAMPNKMFDFASAGLPFCIGPTRGMKQWIDEYDCGWVAEGFSPSDIAREIDGISLESLEKKREGIKRMRLEVNAETEARKLVQIVKKALPSKFEFPTPVSPS